jgi:hypothetical protein
MVRLAFGDLILVYMQFCEFRTSNATRFERGAELLRFPYARKRDRMNLSVVCTNNHLSCIACIDFACLVTVGSHVEVVVTSVRWHGHRCRRFALAYLVGEGTNPLMARSAHNAMQCSLEADLARAQELFIKFVP